MSPSELDFYRVYAPESFTPSEEVASIKLEIDSLLRSHERSSGWGMHRLQKLRAQIRGARLRQARDCGTHSFDQWRELCEEFGYRCACCGIEGVTKDHIIPIYCGGDDSIENIQPMCRRCNSAKNDLINWKQYRRDRGEWK